MEALKERQRQLQILEDQRSQLVRLQQAQQGQRPLPARLIIFFIDLSITKILKAKCLLENAYSLESRTSYVML